MKVYAPGKLILSGEHAVVYGRPALAMAVNRYAMASVSRERLPQILFDLSDLAHNSRLSFGALHQLKDRIKRKYHRFIRGEYSIRDVLQKPFELAHVAMGIFAEALNLSLPHGVRIHVKSDIPMGCGMGSSAATILSVMQAVSHYLEVNLTQDALFQLALEAENLQHGHSSGLDLRVALQGGCLFMQEQAIQVRAVPTATMYLVNTGTPVTSTGQCVEQVAVHFKSNQLADEFAAITIAMDQALQKDSMLQMRDAIKHNHQLLTRIGVVPVRVKSFITAVEAFGVAKTCGAGAVAGEQAGIVLVMTDDAAALSQLCMRFGYSFSTIEGDARGVHVI